MPRRLILIDRAPSQKEAFEALLNEEFELLSFQSFERAMEEIWDLRPHGIIIMEDPRPEEVLRSLRLSEISRDLPLVVVAEHAVPLDEVAAFDAGADGFIPRDCDPTVFKARLLGILRQSYSMRRMKSKLEEMDYFVRTVTHDLKNPIASIYSCAELLRPALESSNLEEARGLVAAVLQSSEHALEFIQDLLSLLRCGTPLKDVEEVSAEEVLAISLEELDMRIRTSGAVISMPQGLPRLTCDRRRLVQVFTNILSNAIKYVPPGVSPRIAINYIETPHANIFVIADNGIGMDPQDTKKIFQSFVRLPEALSYEGSGLGLSIVQRIVEAHEGNVFARSEKGGGSEFYVVLPKKLSPMPQT